MKLMLERGAIQAGFALAPRWAARRAGQMFLAPRRRASADRSWDVSRETYLAVESPNGLLAAWCYGHQRNPKAPTLLLVHGWDDDHSSWAPLADRLVQAGYRVLALDLPGHGRSPLPDNRITPLPVLAAAVAAVGREAEALGMAPLKGLIAHSLGGTAALLAATELGLRAERFAILASPNHPKLFAGALMKMLGLNGSQTAKAFAAIETLAGRSMDSLYLPPKLRRLAAPGLVLHSRDDRVVPVQHSQENAAAWPRADLRVLDGLGHRRLMTDPGVHDMLLHFVGAKMPNDIQEYRPETAA